MAELHVLKTAPSAAAEAVADVLRMWLRRAEAGEITSVGIVAVQQNGSVDTQVIEGENRHAMISGLEILKWRVIEDRHE